MYKKLKINHNIHKNGNKYYTALLRNIFFTNWISIPT